MKHKLILKDTKHLSVLNKSGWHEEKCDGTESPQLCEHELESCSPLSSLRQIPCLPNQLTSIPELGQAVLGDSRGMSICLLLESSPGDPKPGKWFPQDFYHTYSLSFSLPFWFSHFHMHMSGNDLPLFVCLSEGSFDFGKMVDYGKA
jgi:hypothetical protein